MEFICQSRGTLMAPLVPKRRTGWLAGCRAAWLAGWLVALFCSSIKLEFNFGLRQEASGQIQARASPVKSDQQTHTDTDTKMERYTDTRTHGGMAGWATLMLISFFFFLLLLSSRFPLDAANLRSVVPEIPAILPIFSR